jgi:hypothetical protein
MKTPIVILVLFSSSSWTFKSPDKYSMEGYMSNGFKLLQFLLITLICITYCSIAKAKDWKEIDTKKEAMECISTSKCDIDISNLTVQPELFIGKSYFDPKPLVNIANKEIFIPTVMAGFQGVDWKSYGFSGLEEQLNSPYKYKGIVWTNQYDSIVFPQTQFPGNQGSQKRIFKRKLEGANFDCCVWRHTFKIAHALQYGLAGDNQAYKELKDALVEGAKGDYFNTMIPTPFVYKFEGNTSFEGFASAIGNFNKTFTSMLEAHIILQRNNIYSFEEFELVHKWLEKRVWALEQGPMDLTIGSAWKWKHFQEPANHENIWKRVNYLLWGIADQNTEYFSAGVNGFIDAYGTIRKDGSLKTEHKRKSGSNFGVSSGNFTGQMIVSMAIILHNQGFDIQKDYPRVEKFIEFTSKIVENPSKSKYIKKGNNKNLRWMSPDAKPHNNLGYMIIWDKTFNTTYSQNVKDYDQMVSSILFGVADTREVIVNGNSFKSINHKYTGEQYPKINEPISSVVPFNYFLCEECQR